MSINSDYRNCAAAINVASFDKGTVSKSGKLCFEGFEGKSKVKKIVYSTEGLEVTLFGNVCVSRFDETAFGNVGLNQMWFGKITYISGQKDIELALAGPKNQEHIPAEFAEEVIKCLGM